MSKGVETLAGEAVGDLEL